jgi:hypothetical protein
MISSLLSKRNMAKGVIEWRKPMRWRYTVDWAMKDNWQIKPRMITDEML